MRHTYFWHIFYRSFDMGVRISGILIHVVCSHFSKTKVPKLYDNVHGCLPKWTAGDRPVMVANAHESQPKTQYFNGKGSNILGFIPGIIKCQVILRDFPLYRCIVWVGNRMITVYTCFFSFWLVLTSKWTACHVLFFLYYYISICIYVLYTCIYYICI